MTVQHMRFSPNAASDEPALSVEPGRFRLVVYVGCPFCRRVATARRLLGLDSVVALTMAWHAGTDGFLFTGVGGDEPCDPDLLIHSHRELYRRQPDWQLGDSTSVPVLVDDHDTSVRGRIVARESADLVYDFATAWSDFHAEDSPALYRAGDEEYNASINQFIAWINDELTMFFARLVHSNEDDEEERNLCQLRVVKAIGALNDHFENRTWAVADQPSAADVALFSQLVTLAADHAKRNYQAGYDSAMRQGATEEGADAAGRDAVVRAGSPFSDWSHINDYYARLAADPLWLPEGEKYQLKLA